MRQVEESLHRLHRLSSLDARRQHPPARGWRGGSVVAEGGRVIKATLGEDLETAAAQRVHEQLTAAMVAVAATAVSLTTAAAPIRGSTSCSTGGGQWPRAIVTHTDAQGHLATVRVGNTEQHSGKPRAAHDHRVRSEPVSYTSVAARKYCPRRASLALQVSGKRGGAAGRGERIEMVAESVHNQRRARRGRSLQGQASVGKRRVSPPQ